MEERRTDAYANYVVSINSSIKNHWLSGLGETSTIVSPCYAPLLHTSLPAESTPWTEENNQRQTMDALNARLVDLLVNQYNVAQIVSNSTWS
jgi:hypothetical protein